MTLGKDKGLDLIKGLFHSWIVQKICVGYRKIALSKGPYALIFIKFDRLSFLFQLENLGIS